MHNFIDNYLFLFKEYFNYILTINIINININTFIGIFIFGFLTSLNPCSISIVPIYFTYTNSKGMLKSNSANLLFITGYFANFITIGIFIIYFARVYRTIVENFDLTSGILLSFIGVTLLKVLPMTSLLTEKNLPKALKINEYINTFFIGFTSGFLTSTCNIPILITLLTWLSSLNNSIISMVLAMTYLVGYSMSIIFVSILKIFLDKIVMFNHIISWLTSILGAITLSSGIFSICHFFKL
uniref:cytochrome c biogenesis protein transmembrane region n=1 Tax=Sahlingia subintegra TaxID=468936 RepID=UPI001FCD779D|nr:cytochrome c biogenesis protein transmembrane region [Sahlingia subintegra]UNJ17352.1 cytochrome c biogenesis protein transmembrane region [Sahlingia subintegra]